MVNSILRFGSFGPEFDGTLTRIISYKHGEGGVFTCGPTKWVDPCQPAIVPPSHTLFVHFGLSSQSSLRQFRGHIKAQYSVLFLRPSSNMSWSDNEKGFVFLFRWWQIQPPLAGLENIGGKLPGTTSCWSHSSCYDDRHALNQTSHLH